MTRPRGEFKPFLETAKEFTDPPTAFTVYGEPPSNTNMNYPAVRFEKDDEDVVHADNLPYDITNGYLVTVIESDPNTPVANQIRKLPWCSFNRYFVSEQMYHTVYKIFF